MQAVPHSTARRGFTLIEMLVVITIILILLGLTAGAVLRYHDIQQKVNTEWLLGKLDSVLRQHWNAVIAQAKDEAISPQVTQMAGTDAMAGQRARVIHIKLRLKQEFPMNCREAITATLPPRPQFSDPGIPAKPSYAAALPASVNGATDKNGNSIESAACLYAALQLNRNGTSTSVDQILTGREVVTDPTTKVKYLVDDWQNPLYFYRWPYGNTELNPPGGALQPGASQQNNDLEDPQGLLSTNWPQKGQVYGLLAMAPPSGNTSYHLEPIIVSAGRNAILGLDLTSMAVLSGSYRGVFKHYNGKSYKYLANDNLDSYHVRKYGRGD